MQRAAAAREDSGKNPWRATLSGLCATLVGIGLARFAYTPLIPVLIAADWFAPSQVVYLGAANLAGYLAGALLASPMAARAPAPTVLRVMMVLATATFFACVAPISFAWFFVWRFLSGLSGGVLMVLAAATVLPHVRPFRQGLAGGVIFTGVGLGIAVSGTLVPLLLQIGLAETWLGLGALALLLTVVAWAGWPDAPATAPVDTEPAPAAPRRRRPGLVLKSLYVEYGLNAVGLVPHMVFLVDFIARELDRGLEAGAWYWVLFGLGAMLGPVLAGYIADRIGFRRALRLAFLIQAACVGWLAVSDDAVGLAISSIVVGAFVPGIVSLVLGRIQELIPPDPRIRTVAWGFATTAFALGQAGAAYGFSYIFASGGGYGLLFALGAAALLLALVFDLVVAVIGTDSDDLPADQS
jgi:predicted MFS family arabinose efflux permease